MNLKLFALNFFSLHREVEEIYNSEDGFFTLARILGYATASGLFFWVGPVLAFVILSMTTMICAVLIERLIGRIEEDNSFDMFLISCHDFLFGNFLVYVSFVIPFLIGHFWGDRLAVFLVILQATHMVAILKKR